jgi:hypothetical protein
MPNRYPEPERNKVIFVTADSSQWMVVNIPFGMILPPTIEVIQPLLTDPVVFYYAETHRLRIPSEAKEV